MSLGLLARQAAGMQERQSEDAESGVLRAGKDLAQAFLAANLEQLTLPPLTLDAVRAATPHGELCEAAPGEPALRCGQYLLGGAIADSELRRATGEGARP